MTQSFTSYPEYEVDRSDRGAISSSRFVGSAEDNRGAASLCAWYRSSGQGTRALGFFPDAIEQHPEYHGDREAFIELTWRDLTSLWRSQHFISNISIDLDGDRAYTEGYAKVYHLGHPVPPADSPFPLGHIFHGTHRYIDIFERRSGEWRISDGTSVLTAMRNESHVKLVTEKHHWNIEKVNQTDLSYMKERNEEMFQSPPDKS